MKISEATFIVVDTETTGLDPKVDQVVEIAAVATCKAFTRMHRGMWATMVKPTIKIPPEASAVHGLGNTDVDYAPSHAEAEIGLASFISDYHPHVICAHQAEFDSAFLRREELHRGRWLCTKRLAMHLWPEAPAHKNMVLRHWLRPGPLGPDTFGISAHRALGDALVTAQLLRDGLTSETLTELGIETVEELIDYAESPILSPVLRFGSKHRNAPMGDVPMSYLEWMLREVVDLDRDTKYTVEHELQQRRMPHAS